MLFMRAAGVEFLIFTVWIQRRSTRVHEWRYQCPLCHTSVRRVATIRGPVVPGQQPPCPTGRRTMLRLQYWVVDTGFGTCLSYSSAVSIDLEVGVINHTSNRWGCLVYVRQTRSTNEFAPTSSTSRNQKIGRSRTRSTRSIMKRFLNVGVVLLGG